MYSNSRINISRRGLLLSGLGAAAAMGLRPAIAQDLLHLAPQPAHAMLGAEGQQTNVLSYDGAASSPVLRLKQGVTFRVTIENRLDQDTTVHWHGIRVPNAMDGVPGLTQPPIKADESFTYEFTPPDAGTFWYHPHANSLQQIGHGLAGLLIVEEQAPVAVDRDVAWLLQDWRLTDAGQIAPGFGSMMDAAMSGRIGNLVTINGAKPTDLTVKAGERIRLRFANASLARIYALRFEGHHPVIIALDGQPCGPHEPEGGRIVLGPAMRADVMIDMTGKPNQRFAVLDDFYDGLSYTLTNLTYDAGLPLRDHILDAQLMLPRNPLPEPDLTNAMKQEINLQGGMMGGGRLKGMGGMNGMAMPGMGGGPVWAINGMSMTGDGQMDMAPLFTLQRGQTCLLTLRNETAWHHPMHIHGFSMKILTRNGEPVPYQQWQDTVLLAPKDTVECAFVADNPGNWMLHCHVADHQMSGLMTVFRVT